MPYAKLRGKIKEKYNTVGNCAKACNISSSKLYARLSGRANFTAREMLELSQVLELNDKELRECFFSFS